MMHTLYNIFWICAGIIFYNYVGYGIILMILSGVKQLFKSFRSREQLQAQFPEVTVVVAAYNEEAVIEEKIKNCLALNYSRDKISFLFITDGSTDGTAEIIRRYPQIYLLDGPERKGKTAALNRAMQYVNNPITVFCDANAMLNRSSIRRIVNHYKSSRTGGVSGEKRVRAQKDDMAAAEEGLYWKYESFLKKLDAELYSVAGAAGELFSIRTKLWSPLPDNVILDDFVISARINLKGYRIAYEPSAYAWEFPSASLKEEKKRKVRISAGGFQAMVLLREVFNVFKYPVLFFQFFSHRFLRWTLTPLSFPVLLLVNIPLALFTGGVFFKITLFSQIIFYLLALAGIYLKENSGKLKILKIFHYILFMNYSVYLGFIRFLKGNQTGVWEKADRKVLVV